MPRENIAEARTVRVLVVDDHPAVRQGLALLLEPEGITVCAEAENRVQALDRLKGRSPDLALVDLSLGDDDGLPLIVELSKLGLPCLVYSMHEDGRHVENAFSAGARGYVTKREVHRVLVEAIAEVAAGRRFVSPRAAAALADQVAAGNADRCLEGLSSQEKQVYQLLGEGNTTKAIAASMNISTRTVESYYTRILVKLALEGMGELRRHAILHLRKPEV